MNVRIEIHNIKYVYTIITPSNYDMKPLLVITPYDQNYYRIVKIFLGVIISKNKNIFHNTIIIDKIIREYIIKYEDQLIEESIMKPFKHDI